MYNFQQNVTITRLLQTSHKNKTRQTKSVSKLHKDIIRRGFSNKEVHVSDRKYLRYFLLHTSLHRRARHIHISLRCHLPAPKCSKHSQCYNFVKKNIKKNIFHNNLPSAKNPCYRSDPTGQASQFITIAIITNSLRATTTR